MDRRWPVSPSLYSNSNQRNKQTCRYFSSPGGCRKNPCNFLHGSSPVVGKADAALPPVRPSLQLNAPLGTCRYYYNFGSCKFGTKCQYRHEEPNQNASIGNNRPGPTTGFSTKLSTEDPPISGIDALRRISVFCGLNFSFSKPSQIVAFVKLLNAADPKNDGWDAQDAQKVLEMVTQENGAKRVSHIITYSSVVSQIHDKNEISFAITYVGCLSYMVTDFIINSTLSQRIKVLYEILDANYECFHQIVTTCMQEIVSARSFSDTFRGSASGAVVFNTLSMVLIEYSTRIKTACREHCSLPLLAESFSQWFTEWKRGDFVDGWTPESNHARKMTIDRLQGQVDRLLSIVRRETEADATKQTLFDDTALVITRSNYSRHHNSGPLEVDQEPPGILREMGPRHNNDFDDIQSIKIPPTQNEMISRFPPFLPGNIPKAPHHLAANSMDRLVDIQFRLLREELLAPLRQAVQSLIGDLRSKSFNTPLQPILDKRGGRYLAKVGQNDTIMVNLYTSVDPLRLTVDKRGMSIEMKMDTPPGSARDASATRRLEYWEAVSRKRLMPGGLVGVLWKVGDEIQLFFGQISSSVNDLMAYIREADNKSLRLRVNFFDPAINPRVMEWRKLEQRDRNSAKILLIEAPIMYESVRPFLVALQREPTSFPFHQYLAHQDPNACIQINTQPPRYTLNRHDFKWNLRCLQLDNDTPLVMNPADPDSIVHARNELKISSRLDNSQVDAVVDCLTRDFCLVQGPPGTGKSFTGVELMRVLLANRVNRILLIAFTNHALDHLLGSVLDAYITKNIARLGPPSKDDRIRNYSIENLEQSGRLDCSSVNAAYGALKREEEGLASVLKELQDGIVSDRHRNEYMRLHYRSHLQELFNPPQWIQELREMGVGWINVGTRKTRNDITKHQFWISSEDITWIQEQIRPTEVHQKENKNKFKMLPVEGGSVDDEYSHKNPFAALQNSSEETEEEALRRDFLSRAGLSQLPRVPSSDRPLYELQEDPMIWLMSSQERQRLDRSWSEAARQHFFEETQEEFNVLKRDFENSLTAYHECQAQARVAILRNADIIGCTTTGAAKLTSILKGVGPTVLLVEEAGQVLEAHILGSLVPSIEHVILIGDPLQLRPTISNYALSMDHPIGKEIYKFDQSTMERLRSAGIPMSQLTTQRRMRPQISSIARKTLYSDLEDNEQVKAYPDVRGLAKNIFFFHHVNSEGGADEESTSKFNLFEAGMIKGLVQHLLRQGSYTKPGSIVILCMYLGQLIKIRDGLRDTRINVILDSRDEADVQDRELNNNSKKPPAAEVSNVKITEQVLLRTVDNFQGEEADIILLSLVRNPGGEGRSGSIGFLKSPNRTNVALTRARHGLYVFGNGTILAEQSPMWKQVIQEFKDQDAYGSFLPIACHRHPKDIQRVATPSDLKQVSPDGGCRRSCDYILKCGHSCNLKCHSDDDNHILIKCHEACCRKCIHGHPCTRECWIDCAACPVLIPELLLDCGHTAYKVPCHQQDKPSIIECREKVEKRVPYCRHSMAMDCSQDPWQVSCQAICNQVMKCCGQICQSRCGDCNRVSPSSKAHGQHKNHSCNQIMHCQHPCPQPCREDHANTCGTAQCKAQCRQSCVHNDCPLGCSVPCDPCMEPCPWNCEHYKCLIPCGLPCVRPPCDFRCTKVLPCGHICSSLCGEPCEQQICTYCITADQLSTINHGPSIFPGTATITLKCRHSFAVETLDKHCGLNSAYEWDKASKSWSRPLLSPEVCIERLCCPICRIPVDALRYRRLTRRGNLEILERNIATAMAPKLQVLRTEFKSIVRYELEEAIRKNVMPYTRLSVSEEELETSRTPIDCILNNETPTVIIDVKYFSKDAHTLFGIPITDLHHWTTTINPLLSLYRRCVELSRTVAISHSSGYENSLSILYELHLQLTRDCFGSPNEAEEHAWKVATKEIGMTPPRAHQRFQVESILLSIVIRFMIGGLAEKYIFALSERTDTSASQSKAWFAYIVFIYKSCFTDAEWAIEIAQSTLDHRQALASTVLFIEAKWRHLHFVVSLKQSRHSHIFHDPEPLAKEAQKLLSSVMLFATKFRMRCIDDSEGNISQDMLEDEFDVPLERCYEQWENFITTIISPTPRRQTVRKEVYPFLQRDVENYKRGDWRICPNGHIITIREVQEVLHISRCSHCGEQIGSPPERPSSVTSTSMCIVE